PNLHTIPTLPPFLKLQNPIIWNNQYKRYFCFQQRDFCFYQRGHREHREEEEKRIVHIHSPKNQ
ncbi:MAG: hypothetical protein LBK06_04005, partial [Planctomycetaceae bacterium]|nr:hypothetical protein [Planctomycetaceae bacterium]